MFLGRLRRFADGDYGWGIPDAERAAPHSSVEGAGAALPVAPSPAPDAAPHVPDIEAARKGDLDGVVVLWLARLRRALHLGLSPFTRAWHFVANRTIRPLARRLGVEESFLSTVAALGFSMMLVLLLQNGRLLIGFTSKQSALGTANVLLRTAREHKNDLVEQKDRGWDDTEHPERDLQLFMDFCREGMTSVAQQEAAGYRRKENFEWRKWDGTVGVLPSPPPPITGRITATDCVQWMTAQIHLQGDMMHHIAERDAHVDKVNERVQQAVQNEHIHKARFVSAMKENNKLAKSMEKQDHDTKKITSAFKKISTHQMPGSSRVGQARAGMWEKWRKSGLTTDSHVIPAHAPKHPVG